MVRCQSKVSYLVRRAATLARQSEGRVVHCETAFRSYRDCPRSHRLNRVNANIQPVLRGETVLNQRDFAIMGLEAKRAAAAEAIKRSGTFFSELTI